MVHIQQRLIKGSDAKALESKILEENRTLLDPKNPLNLINGFTECFLEDINFDRYKDLK